MSSAKSQRQVRFLKGMSAPTFRNASAKEIAEVLRWAGITNATEVANRKPTHKKKINTNKKKINTNKKEK
jgi:hypothetical protein